MGTDPRLPCRDRPDTAVAVENLRKQFAFTKGILFARTLGHVKAVDDVSFEIRAGETLGLVGESAAANPRPARMILNLEDADRRPHPARRRADPRPGGRGAARSTAPGCRRCSRIRGRRSIRA
jgi:hypothetical protein